MKLPFSKSNEARYQLLAEQFPFLDEQKVAKKAGGIVTDAFMTEHGHEALGKINSRLLKAIPRAYEKYSKSPEVNFDSETSTLKGTPTTLRERFGYRFKMGDVDSGYEFTKVEVTPTIRKIRLEDSNNSVYYATLTREAPYIDTDSGMPMRDRFEDNNGLVMEAIIDPTTKQVFVNSLEDMRSSVRAADALEKALDQGFLQPQHT